MSSFAREVKQRAAQEQPAGDAFPSAGRPPGAAARRRGSFRRGAEEQRAAAEGQGLSTGRAWTAQWGAKVCDLRAGAVL